MENWHHYTHITKLIIDALAAGIAGGALMGIFPPIAAFLSIIWLSVQIYDRIRNGPRQSK